MDTFAYLLLAYKNNDMYEVFYEAIWRAGDERLGEYLSFI